MSNPELDRLDRLILNAIQSDFPIAPRPYQILAERLNETHLLELTETEVWSRVAALKQGGFIRRLGAVFNAGPLGYRSTLCAAKVPPDRLERFSALVSQAPQVTHNYLRTDEVNAWFTFTGEPSESVDDFLDHLKQESGVEEIHILESEKLFKITVTFNFQG